MATRCLFARRESLALRLVMLSLMLLGFAGSVSAQDSHYWSEQYGTRSELLGGSVVGSPQDLSTTYYNPGGVTRLETKSFLLSARAFEYRWLTAQDASGNFTDLTSNRLGPSPSHIAGVITRSLGKGTLAYSFLVRQRLHIEINDWRVGADVGSSTDSAASNANLDAGLSESWMGLTWARPAGEFGLGATLFGALRNRESRIEYLSQPARTGIPGEVVASVDDFSYWHLRLLAKLGAYWRRDRLSLGVTVTTPGLALYGQGNTALYRSYVPLDTSLSVPVTNVTLVEEDLPAQFHSPLSAAIGARYRIGRSALYFTCEWFDAVDRFQTIEGSQAPDTGLGATLGVKLRHESKSVVNFAVGFEYSLQERLTFFGSFLTDFSAAMNNPDATPFISTWDIYRITTGAAFTLARVDITLGASFAAGQDNVDRQIDSPVGPALELDEVRYRKIKVFFGFEFGT